MTNTFIVDKIFNKCQTFSGTHFKHLFCLFCPDEGKCVPENV